MPDESALALMLLVLAALFLGVAFMLGTTFGDKWASDRWRVEAVEAGHAEYITQNGQPVWRWRESQQTGDMNSAE